ncbi:unnamed protein product [Jaminaea pallidilutea]
MSALRCPYLLPESTPVQKQPRALMSAAIGRTPAVHSIDTKIAALKSNGYNGIEVHFECLTNEARRIFNLASDAQPADHQMYAAAREVRHKCDVADISVLCLEPFLHYPGLLPVSRRDERLRELPLWFTLTDILGTDMIQIASAMFSGPGVTLEESRIVEDLRILADMGLQWHRPKFWAYEAMCFGAGTTKWTQAWREVQLVDRPNFGMVFDTYQVLGAVYADPTVAGGKRPDADQAAAQTFEDVRNTFAGPHNAANRAKIFFVQLGDAAAPSPPLSEDSPLYDPQQHASLMMTWGRIFRRWPGEGYMPTRELAEVFLRECGWRGWISAEVMNSEAFSQSPDYPMEAAARCRKGQDDYIQAIVDKQNRTHIASIPNPSL